MNLADTGTLSVVIPALNEATALPRLLDQLATQTRLPDQVVVADAGSTDGTRELARARGALVVDGGRPAVGRNAGAACATGDTILFLDADVDLDPDTVECLYAEFVRRDLTAATAHIEPIERTAENLFACEVGNLYLDLMQRLSPHAPGFCILVRREIHAVIGGFDETLALAEDHDYVQRAAQYGRFRVLQDTPVRTSMRRIEKEGLLNLAFKYIYCEIFVITGRPIHEVPFEYEFASFEGEAAPAISGETLADKVGDVVSTLKAMPREVLDTLGRVAEADNARPELIERALGSLSARDLEPLTRYVAARRRLVRMKRSGVLRRVRAAGERVWSELTGIDA